MMHTRYRVDRVWRTNSTLRRKTFVYKIFAASKRDRCIGVSHLSIYDSISFSSSTSSSSYFFLFEFEFCKNKFFFTTILNKNLFLDVCVCSREARARACARACAFICARFGTQYAHSMVLVRLIADDIVFMTKMKRIVYTTCV